MNLLERARSVLEEADYATTAAGTPEGQFIFEDNNVYGVVVGLSSTEKIIQQWENLQDEFIRRNSRSLNFVPEKAWNVYVVFLTEDRADEGQKRLLLQVEEDFRGARKIARSEVKYHNLYVALAPLLPIRLGGGEPAQSLVDRLRDSSGVDEALASALESDAGADRLRNLFMEGA